MSCPDHDSVTAADDAAHYWWTRDPAKLGRMRQPDEGNLFTDMMELGPAPTMAREIVVIVITLALFGAVFALVGPQLPALIVAGLAVVFMAGRFVLGLREWKKR